MKKILVTFCLIMLVGCFWFYSATRICYSQRTVLSERSYMESAFLEAYSNSVLSELIFYRKEGGRTEISSEDNHLVFYGLEWNSYLKPRFSGKYQRVLPYALVKRSRGLEWMVFNKCAEYLTSFE